MSGHQDTLWQVRAIVRSLSAMADAQDDQFGCDVAYALDAIAVLLQPVCERLEGGAIEQDAAALDGMSDERIV